MREKSYRENVKVSTLSLKREKGSATAEPFLLCFQDFAEQIWF